MSGVVEGGADLVADLECLLVAEGAPAFFVPVEFPVAVEGVVGDAEFDAFALHDVDGVVQQGVHEFGGGGGHEDVRVRLVAHEHGQGAGVVEVGVGDKDGVDAAGGELVVGGQGVGAFFLRVHAGVEDDAFAAKLEEVAVGADFVFAEEGLEGHGCGEVGVGLLAAGACAGVGEQGFGLADEENGAAD